MEITREALLERKAYAEKMREDALGQANAWNGAANECERLIGILDGKQGDAPSAATDPEMIAPSGADQSASEESTED